MRAKDVPSTPVRAVNARSRTSLGEVVGGLGSALLRKATDRRTS
ncbi:hypothetical protein [Streptomyces sp. NPDC059166]